MTKQPYHNAASQAERRQVLKDTFHGRAVADQGMVGGRFAAQSKSTVIGSKPIEYPALPEISPWHHAQVGQEPSLGFSIEDHPAVGEAHEISLSEARDDADPPSAPLSAGEAQAPRGGSAPADASSRPRRLSKHRRG